RRFQRRALLRSRQTKGIVQRAVRGNRTDRHGGQDRVPGPTGEGRGGPVLGRPAEFHLPFGYFVREGLRGDRAALDGLMEEPSIVERLLGCSNRCEGRFDELHRFASQTRIALNSARLTPPRWTAVRYAPRA